MIGIFYFAIGFLSGLAVDKLLVYYYEEKSKFTILGNRIHHSVHGLVVIIISFFVWHLFLFGLGIGVIFWHTIRWKKLIFIERRKKQLLKKI